MAQLLGYKTFAQYRLKNSMAQTPENVYEMLNRLKNAYTPVMRAEMEALRAFATQYEGHELELQPWDYSYYANKQKESLYKVNEEELSLS